MDFDITVLVLQNSLKYLGVHVMSWEYLREADE